MSDVPIPDEVLREIISRLPVTPLLRFRCVCKSWKSLIDSDQFIKHHLNHSRESNSNLNIIIKSPCLYSADFDDDLFTETNPGTFQELFHPLKTSYFGTEILGSCDGLLVLSNGEEQNILWNPSTRRFHNIPVTDMDFPTEFLCAQQFIVYGFGYDAVSDDYKLIRIVQYYAMASDERDSEVKVYTLKSNSWRRISNFPYFLGIRRDNGELANGALHWVVSDTHSFQCVDNLVAAFDLATEDYRLVPLPEFFESVKVYMYLRVLGGCLSLVCDYNEDHLDIWVMKEYGVQESWSKFFTLVHTDICYKNVEFLMPIAHSDCGRKVLIRFESCFMWYDLDTKSVDLPVVQVPYEGSFLMHTCLKSLVLLNNDGVCDFDIVSKNKREEKEGIRRVTNRRNCFLSFWFNKFSLD